MSFGKSDLCNLRAIIEARQNVHVHVGDFYPLRAELDHLYGRLTPVGRNMNCTVYRIREPDRIHPVYVEMVKLTAESCLQYRSTNSAELTCLNELPGLHGNCVGYLYIHCSKERF